MTVNLMVIEYTMQIGILDFNKDNDDKINIPSDEKIKGRNLISFSCPTRNFLRSGTNINF